MKWLAFTYVPARRPWSSFGRGGWKAAVPARCARSFASPVWFCAALSENSVVVLDRAVPWLKASSVPELQAVCAMRGIDWDSDVRLSPDAWWDPDAAPAEGPRPSWPGRGPG